MSDKITGVNAKAGGLCKNKRDSLFFTRLFVSERKQIAPDGRQKIAYAISCHLLATKSLRNGGKCELLCNDVIP